MNDLKNKLKTYINNNLINEKPRKNEFFSKIKCLYMDECCEEDFEKIESSYNTKKCVHLIVQISKILLLNMKNLIIFKQCYLN